MNDDILFLSLDDVVELHKHGIDEFGGSHGVRDLGLIDSAVAAARNAFEYENSDIAGIAAAYLYSLCCNQGLLMETSG